MPTTIKYSLDQLKNSGYIAEKVEQWIPHTSIRKDLFGFADIIAIKDGLHGVFAIQSTTKGLLQAHCEKAMEECGVALRIWLEGGNWFVIHGWSDKGKCLDSVEAKLNEDSIIYFVEGMNE